MQKIVASVVALLCAFSFAACNQEKYQKNNADGAAWLGQHTRKASTSIKGEWISPDWGTGTFKQTGRKVTGSLGDYAADGVVSGRNVYLLLISDGWVYYTAVLEKNSAGALVGHYSEGIPPQAKNQEPLVLKRW